MKNNHNVTLSNSAAKRIIELSNKSQDKGKILRISVKGGGCFGFQYKYTFVDAIEANDVEIKNKNAFVIIDSTSLEFIKNSVVDYVETLGFSSFEIKNPNSKSSCGCGNSFST